MTRQQAKEIREAVKELNVMKNTLSYSMEESTIRVCSYEGTDDSDQAIYEELDIPEPVRIGIAQNIRKYYKQKIEALQATVDAFGVTEGTLYTAERDIITLNKLEAELTKLQSGAHVPTTVGFGMNPSNAGHFTYKMPEAYKATVIPLVIAAMNAEIVELEAKLAAIPVNN